MPFRTRNIDVDRLAHRARQGIFKADSAATTVDARKIVRDKICDFRDVVIRTVRIKGLRQHWRIPGLRSRNHGAVIGTGYPDSVFRATPKAFVVIINSLITEAGGCEIAPIVVANRPVDPVVYAVMDSIFINMMSDQ